MDALHRRPNRIARVPRLLPYRIVIVVVHHLLSTCAWTSAMM
jgi:hypothetical protein